MRASGDSAKLHISFNPDSSRPMVQLYGNPQGLRQLAMELLRIADREQSGGVEHDPADHCHYKSSTNKWIIDNSVELTVGRIDHRETGCTDWYEENTAAIRAYLQQRLEQLDRFEKCLDPSSPS